MNWLSRLATILTITGIGLAYWRVEFRGAGAVLSFVSVAILWVTREMSHRGNRRLRGQVVELEGGVGRLGSEAEKNRPERNVAAAITGQGELATWNYAGLVERMRRDGLIG